MQTEPSAKQALKLAQIAIGLLLFAIFLIFFFPLPIDRLQVLALAGISLLAGFILSIISLILVAKSKRNIPENQLEMTSRKERSLAKTLSIVYIIVFSVITLLFFIVINLLQGLFTSI